MLRIVLTGPECSGKTTLVKKLAKYFGVQYVEEFALKYLELIPNYKYSDLDDIAVGQHNLELNLNLHERFKGKNKLLLCDTDILTIKIWSEVVFKKASPKINNFVEEIASVNDGSIIYLLCSPEGIDWEFHPQRENPNDRDKLFLLYENLLKNLNFPHIILRGDIETRFKDAVKSIEENAWYS